MAIGIYAAKIDIFSIHSKYFRAKNGDGGIIGHSPMGLSCRKMIKVISEKSDFGDNLTSFDEMILRSFWKMIVNAGGGSDEPPWRMGLGVSSGVYKLRLEICGEI